MSGNCNVKFVKGVSSSFLNFNKQIFTNFIF